MSPRYLLAQRRCSQCLYSPAKIVGDERRREILAACRTSNTHFLCHKGTICGETVTCRGWHDAHGPSLAMRLAQSFGIPVIEIDADQLEAGVQLTAYPKARGS